MSEATPPRRRWFQFRLRTILAIVTAVAIVLGLSQQHDKMQLLQSRIRSLEELLKIKETEAARDRAFQKEQIDDLKNRLKRLTEAQQH